MAYLYWLEEDSDTEFGNSGVKGTADLIKVLGIKYYKNADPTAIKNRVQSKIGEDEQTEGAFLVDLLLPPPNVFRDWNNKEIDIYRDPKTELGIKFIKYVLCHQDSVVKDWPVAVLTKVIPDASKDWRNYHITRNKLDKIIENSGRKTPIEIISKYENVDGRLRNWLLSVRDMKTKGN